MPCFWSAAHLLILIRIISDHEIPLGSVEGELEGSSNVKYWCRVNLAALALTSADCELKYCSLIRAVAPSDRRHVINSK